jgi:Acetokinase family
LGKQSGLLLYLLAQKKISPKEVNILLNKESGLLRVSGTSADMRDLLGKTSDDVRAADAVEPISTRQNEGDDHDWIFGEPGVYAAGQESQRATLRGFEILAESKKRARK